MKKPLYIGVDVGGTKIAAALIDQRGKIRYRKKISVPKQASRLQLFHTIVCLIKDLRRSSSVKNSYLKGIGIGIPGIVNAKTGKIMKTPNIDFSGFDLATKLKKVFPVKIAIENDVNLGVLGEKWLGIGQKAKNIVGLFPGTGIGGGIIVDNRLLTGSNGAAAEIGHVCVDPKGPRCTCGHDGCLEAFASRWAIERDIRKAIRAGQKSIIVKITKNNLRRIKSGAIKEALKKKDPLVQKIMQKNADILGQSCINLRRIFDPDIIILGGGLMEACGNYLLPKIKRVAQKDKFFKTLKPCPIVLSCLGDDAVILGAVCLVQ